MLRDIFRETPKVQSTSRTIVQYRPDILIIQSFDYDAQFAALKALALLLNRAELDLAYLYAPRPNTGIPTGFDIDGNGRTNDPRDAQGYGRFPGQAGIAVLSRYPIDQDAVETFSHLLWKATTQFDEIESFLPREAIAIQRLASVAYAAIPFTINDKKLWVLTHHATPPVFDGPEDRNGHRNADENLFWLGQLSSKRYDAPYVLAAQMNVDPFLGEGHHHVISDILTSNLLNDPFENWPHSDAHTVTYHSPGPGNLRVSYVLPSPDLEVISAGLSPPFEGQTDSSRHRLVWIDVALPE